jgi:hypothetical protein
MSRAAARRFVITLATALVTVAVASACVFDPGPPISCQSVSGDDCNRAVDLARPLMRSYWELASEVHVHPGRCSQYRHCPATLVNDQGFITVDLVSDQPETAFVVIDRRHAEWSAICAVTVRDANGAHGEPCAT